MPLLSSASSPSLNGSNNPKNGSYNMKFRSSALSLLALSVPASTTAWAPLSAFGGLSRPSTALFSAVATYSTEQVGEAATESFRLQFKGEGGSICSPWHDIPLEGDTGYNMVVEIPKMTKVNLTTTTTTTRRFPTVAFVVDSSCCRHRLRRSV